MKTINVKAYNTKKITKELPVVTNDGQPTIIKAEKGINYEFFDQSIGRAPNHIITKRSGKDLHLSFERDGKETDLIIEGFYDNEDHALIGIAEDGQYYYYIPDTGEVSEYVTQLVEGKVEGQALGGEHLVAPWWVALPNGAGMPWWLGLGVLPVLFSGDDDSPTNTPEPTPSTTISTSPNSKTDEPHQSVTQNVISNDKSVTHLNLSSLVIIDPKTGKPSTENNGDTLTIANQGVWSVVKDANGNKTGEIKFTPNADFIQNPTPINYQVKDNAGNLSVPTPVAVIYNQPLSPDIKTGKTGTTVTQNVLLNDSANTTKDSLKLVDKHGNGVDSLHVDGQGVWTVIKADGKPTGEISFQPDAGFVSNPTPVQYQVIDNAGNAISTSVAVIYDNNPNITNPDVKAGKPGQPVTINATNNDGTVKPETIKLIDPNNPGSVDKPNLVDSVNTFTDDGKPEGTWQIVKDSTGKPTGEVLFTPAPTFLGEPKPINYVITGENGQVLPPTPIIVSYPPVPVAPATPPVAKDDTQTATAVGIATTVAVVGNDTDPENNIDPTTVVISQAPAGTTIAADGKSAVVNGEGTWTVDPATGDITFTPEASFKGDPTPISYTVKDSTGLVSNPATVTIDYPAATAPVAKDDTQTATAVGIATTVAVVGNDTDPENNIDPTTVQIVGSTDGKTLVVNGEGTWTVDRVTGSITFKPDADFKGDPTPISYTVKDSTGNTSNPATVTVDYPQNKPVATNDTAAPTTAGTPVTVNVLGNDTDANNDIDPTTVQIVGSTDGKTLVVAGEGTWTVNPTTGEITFTPDADFKGDPTPISYTVKDSTGNTSNPATVTVDYPQNKPVATNDTAAPTTAGTPVTVNVLGNDTDANNDIDPTTVQIVGSTDGKTLVVNGEGTWTVDRVTGSITFKPDADFKGDPTPISYTVKDSTGNTSNPATVTVDYPQNKPVATNDTAAPTTAGTPVTVNVLGNDTDANNDIDPTTVQIVGSTDGKTLVVAGEGTWTVNPTTGEITFTPDADFKGDPTPISYTVKDSTGNTSNPATVTVDYPQNKPVATNDTAAPTTAGTPVTVNVLGNDTDANNDIDPTTVQIVGSTDGKTLVVAGEGTWTVNPTTGEITFTPDADFKGDPTPISYTVKDSTGNTSNPATVTVDYPQNKPVATNDTAAPTTAGTPVTVNVLGNDTDANNDIDPTTVQIVGSTDGKTLVVAGQGTWTVDPVTGSITFKPEASFKGDPAPISYTVKDSTGLVSSPATVTIDYPQDKPVATNDTQAGTAVGGIAQPVTVNVLTNDSDPNNNLDPTSVVITQAPAGSTIAADGKSVVVNGQGTWTVDPVTGSITFKPEASFKGDPAPISYTVKDSTGLVSSPATVTIDYPQDKPVATNDTIKPTTAGTPVTVDVLGNDSDPNNNIDPTTVKLIDPATNTPATSVTIANQGTWSVAADGKVTFTPVSGFTGDPTPISYTVADKTGLVSDPATITVDYPQDKPVATNDTQAGTSGQPVVINVLSNDTDAQNDIDPSTVVLVGGTNGGKTLVVPNQGTWSVAADGKVTFTPVSGFTGDPTPISYTVADRTGLVSDPATITVDYPQDKPVATNDTQAGTSGQPVVINVLSNDTDAQNDIDPSTVVLVGGTNGGKTLVVPNQGTWSVAADGKVTFTPVSGFTGDPTPISYTVADKTGLVSDPATITVDYPQDKPVATNDTQAGTSGQPVVINVLSNDTDAQNDIDPSTVVLVGGTNGGKTLVVPNQGTWSVAADGKVTFTPVSGFTGDPTPISYTVADRTGLVSDPATITVDYPQDKPVATNDTQAGTSGQPVVINVLSNDTDAQNDIDPSTVVLVGGTNGGKTLVVPNQGTWSVAADGKVTFTPVSGFTGDPTPISYTVADKTGLVSDPATITVDYPQDKPVATNDTQAGTSGQPVVINVLSNDTDAQNDIDPSTVVLVGGTNGGKTLVVPNQGTWSVAADGKVTFTPVSGFTGDPTPISYTVADKTGLVSDPATITVDYPQDKPVATNDTQAGTSGQPVVINVLSNDTDAQNDIDPSTVVLVGGTNGGKTLVVPNQGTWSVAADGKVTFTPVSGFTGDPTPISYTVADKTGLVSDPATITVDYPQDKPVATNDTQAGTSGQPVVINVLSNDTDAQNDIDPSTVVLVGGTNGGKTLVVPNQGTWSVAADGKVTFTPVSGFTGDPTPISYTVADKTGLVSDPATITVDYPQDKPVATNDTQAGTSGQPVVINVLSNDTDAQNDIDPSTVVLVGGTNGGKTLVVPNQGTWSVAADGKVTFTPVSGFTGDPTPISYTVADKTGLVSDPATITVDYPQDKPVATNDTQAGTSGQPVVINVLSNDTDAQNDIDPSTVVLVGGTNGGKTLVVPNQGTWSVAADGKVTFTPVSGFTGDPTPISYTVADKTGLVSDPATITVDYPQDKPVATNDTQAGTSGQPVVINVLSNDTDAQNDIDPSTVVLVGGTNGGKTLVVPNQGTWSVAADGKVTFTPVSGFTGDPTPISYTVADKTGLVSDPATITVDYPQDKPVATNDTQAGTSGQPVVINVLSNDTDAQNDIDPSTVVLVGGTNGGKTLVVPNQGTWSVAADGKVTFTPVSGFTGDPTPISYTVADKTGLVSDPATITVDYPQDKPVATNDTQAGTSGQPVVINVLSNDTDAQNDIDPSTVVLVGGTNGGKTLVVPNQGTWSVAADGKVTFTPVSGFTGDPTPISYTVADKTGLVSDPATITVDYPQDKPVATNDTQAGTSGQPVVINVLSNDTDAQNDIDPSTVVLVGGTNGGKTLVVPNQGTWSVAADGKVTFTPVSGFTGDPTPISYTVADKTGLVSDPATITVDYPQDKPVATNDTQAGTSGQPVVINVLSNDTDAQNDIDPSTVVLVGGTNGGKTLVVPNQGTWSVAADGKVTFTPVSGFTGDPTPISYTVADRTGLVSDPATITVDYPQDKPVATNDTQAGTSGQPVVINVLSNDTDAQNDIDPSTVVLVGGTNGGKTLVVPNQGTWSVAADGKVTFTPVSGFTGDPTPISYTVADKTGLVSDPATITVDYPQDKPVATNDTQAGTSGQPVVINVLSNDTDAQNDIDPSTVVLVGGTNGGKTLVVPNQGTWSVAADGKVTFTPVSGFTGDPTPISYTVADKTGLVSDPATITVDYPQDKPVATNDTQAGTSGQPVVINVLSNDTDAQNDIDPSTVVLVGGTNGGKTLVVPNQGTWSVAADGKVTFTPVSGFTGDPTPISYTVADKTGLVSDPATITVDYPQDKPVATNDTQAGTSGQPVVINVLSNDTDAQNDIDPSTVVLVGGTNGGKTLVVPNQGTWSVAADGKVTFTPVSGFTGDPTPISYTVADKTGLVSDPATITVDYPQDKPVATNDTQAGTSGQPVVINVLSNDTDAQNDIDPSTVVLVGGTNGGKTLVVPNQGTWSVAADGKVTFTPVSGFTGDPTPISYTVADKTGLVSDPATITVDYPQDKPVATNDTQAGTSGQPVVINVLSNDTDAQNDIDPSTVVLVGGTNGGKTLVVPNQGTWSVAADGKVTFTPVSGFTGDPTPISYTVADKTGLVSDPATITVDYPQDKPVATNDTQAGTSGQPVVINVLSNDTDAQNDIDPSTVVLVGGTNGGKTLVVPNQGTWSVAADGKVTFTPVSGFTGDPTPISYTVADRTGLVSDPATITVDYPQDKPVATNDTQAGTSGQPVVINVLSNDTDAQNDIDPSTVVLVGGTNGGKTLVVPNQGTWSVAADGKVTFTPVSGFTGDPTPISYTVADKTGLVSDPATITVDYPQDKPVATNDTQAGTSGQPVVINVLSNDTDAQNDIDPSTVVLVGGTNGGKTLVVPNQGTWSVAADGKVTFTPVSGFTGDPTPISYTVADRTGLVSDPATITVDYPQDKPVATNDTQAGTSGQPVVINVLSNDTDAQNDIDPSTVVLVGGTNGGKTLVVPNQGTWSVAADGKVTFTPVSGFTGDPTPISYTVADKTGLVSDPATITVDYPQDKPVATNDTQAGTSGQPVVINVLSNDTDAQNDIDPSTVVLVGGTNGGKTLVVPNQGTWSVAADGKVTFTPVSGFTGDPTPISYTVADRTGLVSDPATITVDYPQDKPVATNDTQAGTSGQPVVINVLSNDTDAQNDIDPSTVVLVGGTNGGKTLVVPNQGTWSVAADGKVTFTPVSGFTGDPTPISYTVADKTGLVSDPATITVDYPQDKPVATNDTQAGTSGQPVVINVLSNDTDAQNDIDPSTVVLVGGTNGGKTLVVPNQGTWSVAADGKVTFTPVSGFTGDPTPISYTVADKTGLVSDPATITVDYPQDKPVATNDTQAGTSGQPVVINVLSNDTDAQNDIDPSTVVLVGGTNGGKTLVVPNQGTWSVAADGKVTFTPVSGFTGDPTPISYTVADKTGLVSDPATITVDYPQDKPVATNDTQAGTSGQPVVINVLSNDTDAQNDIDPSTVVLVGGTNGGKTLVVPNQGTWSVAADGKVTFTPVSGFTGDPTPISYTVADRTGLVSDPATITVDYPQDKPVATNDTQAGTSGQPVVINVLSNDTDAQNDIDPSTVVLVGGTNGGKTLVVPNQGTWSVAADGKVTFTPVSGFTGDPTPISYTVADRTGLVSDPATITVDYPQDKPVATNDTQAGTSGQPVVINVLSNDTDAQNDIDPSTVVLVGGTNGGKTLVVPNQGTWSVAADGKVTFTPVSGFTGDPTPISYTVADKTGLVSDPATITVDYPQDKPVATNDTQAGTSGQPVVINVLSNDTDAQNDIDPSTVVLVGGTNGGKTLVVPNQGTWSVAADGKVTFTPVSGFTGDPTPISYTVADKTGLVSDPATITVDYPQDKPVATNDTQAGTSGQPVVINVLSNDTDAQNDIDPSTVVLVGGTNGGKTLVVPNQGTWSVAADGKVTFTPVSGFTGDPTPISYTVADKTGLVSDPATITVDYPQDKPVATNDTQAGTSGQPVVINVLSNDTDAQNDIDPSTVVLVGGTNGGKTLVVPNQGTWSVAADGKVTFTPVSGFTGDPTPISYTVADKTGLVSDPATITVDYPQDKPVATNDTQAGTSGQPVVINVLSNDTDAQNDIDPSTVVLVGGTNGGKTLVVPNQGTWSVAADGKVTFTPVSGFTGDPTPISYTVADKTGLVSDPATITVDYPQDKPVATNDTQAGTSGQPVVINVLSNDTDAQNDIDPSTVVLVGGTNGGKTLVVPNQGTWSVAADGKVTFTPVSGFTGDPTPISYTVADRTGLVSDPATITVDYPQDKPVATNDTQAGTSGQPVVINVLSNDTDAQNDIDPSTVVLVGGTNGGKTLVVPNQGTWSVAADGKVTFTPVSGFTGDPTPISYTVKDSTGLVSNPATVTIDYPQDKPVASNDTQAGTAGEGGFRPVTVNVLTNDSDPNNNLDPTTVVITQAPAGSTIAADGKSVVVAGQGTWTVDRVTGNITFKPDRSFKGDPTPISYTVKDSTGNTSNPATVTVDYPQDPPVATNETAAPTTAGTPVTVSVLNNDTDANNNIDPTTVVITQAPAGSTIAADGKSVVVAGEGTWTVDPATGNITFTPEASFKGDPAPISYTVKDSTGLVSNPATVTIDYPDKPVATNDTIKPTTAGTPVTFNVLSNDTDAQDDIDPTSVKLLDPNGNPVTTLDVPGEGTWTVDPATGDITFTPEASFKGDPTPISYTVKDSTGLVSNPATVTIDYPQQPPLLTSKLAVSEEALTYGIKDSIGNPTDTTDSAAATGSFGAATSAITTISAPTTAVYSGGEKVIWTSANGVLTGKTETTGVDVIKVTPGAFAAATGAGYTVTLLKAIDHPTGQDENTLDITFDVQTSTEMGQITLTVEDDAPVTTNATLSASSSTISSFYANVNLIMDLSGSTAYGSGIPGKTVFQAMKDSVNKLLDYYQGMLDQAGGNGDVRVDISVFASIAKHLSLNGSTPSYWVSIADAKKLLNTIQPPNDGSINNGVGVDTNYDAALQEMIKGYQQSNVGPLQNKPGLTNSAYFFTDGEPNFYTDPTGSNPNNTGWDSKHTPGHSGINPGSFSGYVAGGNTEIGEKDWTDFLTANKIKAYAIGLDVIGLGRSVDIANITPISYDGTTATNADAILAKRITDYSQLDTFLASTVTTSSSAPAPLTATGLIKSGADANYTASMTVDNITYTYQTSTGKITSDYVHTAWKDLGNGDLQVTTHSGGTVSLHLGQGANLGNMTYQVPSSILNGHTSETISYTITDGDGDKASGTATIDLSALPKLVEHALQASTSTTVSGTANVADVFTLSGLTNNGSDTITNFEVGIDKLGFSGIKEISDLKNISAEASGGNTVVHFTTADTIASHLTLTGVTLDTTTIQNWLVNNSVIM